MKYRPFVTGFDCSEISLGTLGLAGGYGPIDKNESVRAIKAAVDQGVNLIDTADVYGQGLGEELIQSALKPTDEVLVVTKVGRDWYQGDNQKNWDPKYLSYAVQQSLKRLKQDSLDVCLLHNPDLETILRGQIFATLEDLKHRGLLRFWGVSITTAKEGDACLRCSNPDVIQFTANIAESELLIEMAPLLNAREIGVMVRMPLAGGLLTGKYLTNHEFSLNDYRSLRGSIWIRKILDFSNEGWDRKKREERIKRAMEFVLNDANVSTAICGMKTPRQVAENLRILYHH